MPGIEFADASRQSVAHLTGMSLSIDMIGPMDETTIKKPTTTSWYPDPAVYPACKTVDRRTEVLLQP